MPIFVDFIRDVRYGVRILLRNPAFAVSALLALTLGIGATTAVFSIADAVLVRPLPYPEAGRLVRVWEERPGGTALAGNRWITNRTYHAWLARPRTIDVLGGFGAYERTIRIGEDDVRVVGPSVSPRLLRATGAAPQIGRLLTDADAKEGADPVLVLGDTLWRTRFGSDSSIVGQRVAIDGEPYTIVGVLRPGYDFPDSRARLWVPYVVPAVSADPAVSQRTTGLSAVARLAPGATREQAEAEGTAIARGVAVTPATRFLFGSAEPPVMHVRPLLADVTGDVRPALLLLAASAGCILLIACANVTNLLLSHGAGREREFAVRAATGAGWNRLLRQLLAESLLLSTAGGAAGLVLGWGLITWAARLAPVRFPRLTELRLDGRVLLVAVVASFVTVVAAGLVPAIGTARRGAAGSLQARGASPGRRRFRDSLLVAQSAFALMLLVGACLLARSLTRLAHVDPGYVADRVLTARVLLPPGSGRERPRTFVDTVLARLRAAPGVVAAGVGNMMPMAPMTAMSTMSLPESLTGVLPAPPRAVTYVITPGYAEALGLRLRQGRYFDARDGRGGTRALLVNDEFARQYLRGAFVGRPFTAALYSGEEAMPTEIVGVVGRVLKDGNDRQAQPEIYFADGERTQRLAAILNFVVRTAGDPAPLSASVRTLIRGLDPGVTIERVEPLAGQLSASMSEPRFETFTLVAFATTAVLLASVGLYGVLSYSVSLRRRELGVRAALGASRGGIVRLVLGEGLRMAVLGIAIGLGGAAMLTRWMRAVLFGVTPLDPVAFAAAAALLALVAAAACLVPASRAASTDPMEALRSE